MTTSSFQDAAHKHLWMHFAQLAKYSDREIPTIVRGVGPHVWDDKGQRYIDGLSSLYCVNVGHGRKEIVEAVQRQMSELSYFSIWNYATPPAAALAEKISELTPGEMGRVFFTSGGSESVESAWKLARQYHRLRGSERKTKIIARQGAYHGTTMGALSITGLPNLREPFEPLVPGVLHAPTVNSYRATVPEPEHSIACVEGIAEIIAAEGAETVAAVILEPVQNAGGCLPADPAYFARLREICDANDVLLISDETVCAWGRLGTFFGSAAIGYQPDIITTAKALTSAYVPMGAVIVRDTVAEPFLAEGALFSHGLTFGGHPAAAAAALANIAVIEDEDLCARAILLGERMRRGLEKLYEIPIVGDVRGAGLFLALELVSNRETKAGFAPEVIARWTEEVPRKLYERGLICRALYGGAPIVQFAPPLVMSEADVDELVAITGEVLSEIAAEVA